MKKQRKTGRSSGSMIESLEGRQLLSANGLIRLPVKLVDHTTEPSSTLSDSQLHAKHVAHLDHVRAVKQDLHEKHLDHLDHVDTLVHKKIVRQEVARVRSEKLSNLRDLGVGESYSFGKNLKDGVSSATMKANGRKVIDLLADL